MQLNANQRVDGSFCNHPGTSLKKPPHPTTHWHTQLASNARVVRQRRCCKRGEGGHTSSSQWRKKKGSRSDVSVFFSPSILFFGRWEGAMSTLLSSFFSVILFFFTIVRFLLLRLRPFAVDSDIRPFFHPRLYLDVYKYFSFGEINQRVVYTPAALQYL